MRELIAEHVRETHSAHAAALLDNWDRERGKFWQVVPKELVAKLDHPIKAAEDTKLSA